MHKIDGAGHVDNTFVQEDALNNIPPTLITKDWLNTIQAELANFITSRSIPLDKSDDTQLTQAITDAIKARGDKIVRVASTAAINLAAPGANIDGTVMVAGDTFLEKDNAALAVRGIYVWNGAAVPATRDPAADTGAKLFGGMIIRVKEGTVNADTNWQVTNDGVVTVGVTGLTFQKIGGTVDATALIKGIVQLALASDFNGIGSAEKVPTVSAIIAGLLGAGGGSGNDYITIPYRDKNDGTVKKLIVQWGSFLIPGIDQGYTSDFPISFPSACLRSFVSKTNNLENNDDVYCSTIWASASQIRVRVEWGAAGSSNGNSTRRVEYLAIGN
ncbi:MAG: hypothetical protein Q7U15_05910 [Methylotenera sp.]|nr:hypothetical protein [Methylotenera sp.]